AAYFNWADPAEAANRSGSLCAMKTVQRTTDQGRWRILKCEEKQNRFVKVDDICARTSSASLSLRLTRELNGSNISCCAFGSGNFVSCSDSLILDLEGLNLLTIAIILVPLLVSLALCVVAGTYCSDKNSKNRLLLKRRWKNTKPTDRMKEEALMEKMMAMVKAHNQKVPGMPTSSDVLKTTAGKQDATTTLLAGASNSTLKKPGPASATDFFERLRHGSFFSINLTDIIDEGPVLFNMEEEAKTDEKLAGARRGSYV
ncbi:hypothetical protein ElyMa_002525700, partial [Elysia marginata]